MGYCCLLEEPEPVGRIRALMIAACCLFCKDVPGEGEQDLVTEVNDEAMTVTVSDGTNERTYRFDELI